MQLKYNSIHILDTTLGPVNFDATVEHRLSSFRGKLYWDAPLGLQTLVFIFIGQILILIQWLSITIYGKTSAGKTFTF